MTNHQSTPIHHPFFIPLRFQVRLQPRLFLALCCQVFKVVDDMDAPLTKRRYYQYSHHWEFVPKKAGAAGESNGNRKPLDLKSASLAENQNLLWDGYLLKSKDFV